MSSCTTTVPNSVRINEPVGQTSRQAAWVQCLQTSEDMSQRRPVLPSPFVCSGFSCSTKATCRHVFAPRSDVLSYDSPVHTWPSCGITFHSLHATSHALQPMQTDVSVKKPTRSRRSSPYASPPAGTPVGCMVALTGRPPVRRSRRRLPQLRRLPPRRELAPGVSLLADLRRELGQR